MTLVTFGPADVDPALLGSIQLERKRQVTPAPGQVRAQNPHGYGDMWVAVAALNLHAATPRYDSYGYTDLRDALVAATGLVNAARRHAGIDDVAVLGADAGTAWVRRSLVAGLADGDVRGTAHLWLNFHASAPRIVLPLGEHGRDYLAAMLLDE